MKTGQWMAMVGLAVVGLVAAAAPAEVATFQDGVDGYVGSDDAWLSWHSPPYSPEWKNSGAHVYQTVGNQRSAYKLNPVRSLHRFDLSALAGEYATITSVSFSAAQHSDARGSGTAYLFAVKQANADWVEGTGNEATPLLGENCWNKKAYDPSGEPYGTDWADIGGGLGGKMVNTCTDPLVENDDYDYVPLGSYDWTEDDDEGEVVTWNLTGHAGLTLTDLVDLWSGDQANNAGFILMSNDLSEVTSPHVLSLATNDHTTYAHPTMTVEYSTSALVEYSTVIVGWAYVVWSLVASDSTCGEVTSLRSLLMRMNPALLA